MPVGHGLRFAILALLLAVAAGRLSPAAAQVVPAEAPTPPEDALPAATRPTVGDLPAADRSAGAARPVATGEGTATGAPAPAVDESALRYFAREGDLDRLEAEVRRLKTLYPNWEPPADLFDPNVTRVSDVQPLWDLFQAGRFAEAREAISRRRQEDPSWTPPADLLAALTAAESRQRLINAADAKQWNTVLTIAAEAPGLLVCSNIDILWRVGEAFAGSGRMDRARDLYVYILQNCQNAEERLATMDKALAVLPPEMVEELFRYARPQPDGSDEFAAIRLNLIREEVGAANEMPDATVAADKLATLEAAARQTSSANDAILLGFYYYRHGDPAAAVDWFELALKRGGSAKAAEGAVLALRAAGRDRDAEPIAYEWRNSSVDNMVAYITLLTALLTGSAADTVDQGVVDRFAVVVNAERSALGAQALGWYAYNAGQTETALAWFTQSMQWQASEVGAFGVGLSLQRLRDMPTFQAFVTQWATQYPRLPQLFADNQAQRATTAPVATVAGLAHPGVLAGRPGTPVSPVPMSVPPTAAPVLPVLPALPVAPAPAPGTTEAPLVPRGAAVGAGMPGPAPAAAGPAVQATIRPSSGNAGCVAASDAAARSRRLAPAAALTRAWCLMELDRPREAVDAFDVALTADPQSKTARDAAYGKSLAYLRLGLVDHAAVAATEAPQAETRRAELGAEILTQRALAAYDSGRFVETILALDERARIVPDNVDLMLLRGWSYFQLGDYASAQRLFEAAERVNPGSKARAGINAIYDITQRKRS